MVWCGVVKCGVVGRGVVWHGVVWCVVLQKTKIVFFQKYESKKMTKTLMTKKKIKEKN